MLSENLESFKGTGEEGPTTLRTYLFNSTSFNIINVTFCSIKYICVNISNFFKLHLKYIFKFTFF